MWGWCGVVSCRVVVAWCGVAWRGVAWRGVASYTVAIASHRDMCSVENIWHAVQHKDMACSVTVYEWMTRAAVPGVSETYMSMS